MLRGRIPIDVKAINRSRERFGSDDNIWLHRVAEKRDMLWLGDKTKRRIVVREVLNSITTNL